MSSAPHIPEDAISRRELDEMPRPQAIRFYGTCWVDHSRGYALRRVGLGLGAATLAAGGAGLLFVVYAGLGGSASASWLQGLVVLALALCTAMAFLRTWNGYARPAVNERVDEASFRSIKAVGFVGVLLAYALRTVAEAPGERLLRRERDLALDRHLRTVAKRSRNPARRKGAASSGRASRGGSGGRRS